MRLLLVYPFFPFPPNDGGRIGFFNPIKYLSRAHEVVVFSLASAAEDAAVEELKRFCSHVRIFRRPSGGDVHRLIRGAVAFPPGAGAKYWHPAAGELLRETIARHRPDIVEFHHLNTAVYRRFAGDAPAVLREHNVEYKVWERYAENASGWMEKGYAKWTAPRVRKYEAEAAAQFDRCVVVSHADAVHLREASPKARIEVIASGVDTEYFYPLSDEEEPWTMTVTGSFGWRPKQQSLLSLLTEVFPRIKASVPEAILCVVGKGVPEYLRQVARGISGVTITGPVPDVRPYIARSALMLNYLECGGGIALKVLEAMAMRKPVLCNSLGCEGIPVTHGQDVFVADGPEEFATAAAWLLRDESARARIAEGGYRRVLEEYSWQVIAGRLGEVYGVLLAERGIPRSVASTKVTSAP